MAIGLFALLVANSALLFQPAPSDPRPQHSSPPPPPAAQPLDVDAEIARAWHAHNTNALGRGYAMRHASALLMGSNRAREAEPLLSAVMAAPESLFEEISATRMLAQTRRNTAPGSAKALYQRVLDLAQANPGFAGAVSGSVAESLQYLTTEAAARNDRQRVSELENLLIDGTLIPAEEWAVLHVLSSRYSAAQKAQRPDEVKALRRQIIERAPTELRSNPRAHMNLLLDEVDEIADAGDTQAALHAADALWNDPRFASEPDVLRAGTRVVSLTWKLGDTAGADAAAVEVVQRIDARFSDKLKPGARDFSALSFSEQLVTNTYNAMMTNIEMAAISGRNRWLGILTVTRRIAETTNNRVERERLQVSLDYILAEAHRDAHR